MASDVTNTIAELDGLCGATRERNLTPHQLIELQGEISALRYYLSGCLADVEGRKMMAKDRLELHVIRGKLTLQAQDKKLSSTKADDIINNETDTEQLRQELIRSSIDYAKLDNRLKASKDVLVSLAMRLKGLEQEAIESRITQQRGT